MRSKERIIMAIISIIVPVYNVEKYLPDCVDSILNQYVEDFELILVDDGSTDKSGKICDDYAEKDKRVKTVHQKNGGVSRARNVGLDIASGEYVTFVDADDWVHPSIYSTMLRTAKEENVDVVACGIARYSEDNEFLFSELDNEERLTQWLLMASGYSMPNYLSGSSCNKVFKRSIIKDVRFIEGVKMSEDRIFLFEAFKHCQTGYKIPDILYNVKERNGSATRNKSVDVPYDIMMGCYKLMKMAKSYSKPLFSKAIDRYMDECLRYLPKLISIGKNEHQKYKFKLLKIKYFMMLTIIKAWITHSLPKNKIHGYLFELMQINKRG